MIYDAWDKKRLECEYLYSFRCLLSDFPYGNIECHRESPDFIINTTDNRVGIEITRIYIDEAKQQVSLQSLEATKTRITSLTKRIFEESSELRPASVTLFFNLRRPLKRQEEENVARAVAERIRQNFPPEGALIKLECHPGSLQPTEVDLILINRLHPFCGWDWTEVGIVKQDAIGYLQSAIEEKGRLIRKYLKSCDECWLFIVAPSFRPSGKIHANQSSIEHIYISPFRRTCYLNLARGTVACLNTVAAER